LPGTVQEQKLVFEEKRLRNDGTDTTRSEQADQSSKEMDEKNHQMAHRRIVARWEILRNHGRNNNSPAIQKLDHSYSADRKTLRSGAVNRADIYVRIEFGRGFQNQTLGVRQPDRSDDAALVGSRNGARPLRFDLSVALRFL
jgi:hypothetical protein